MVLSSITIFYGSSCWLMADHNPKTFYSSYNGDMFFMFMKTGVANNRRCSRNFRNKLTLNRLPTILANFIFLVLWSYKNTSLDS